MRAAPGALLFAVLYAACGGGDRTSKPAVPHTASAAIGTYEDGSGRLGIAALTTIRSEGGAGPDVDWQLELERDGAPLGAPAIYAAGATYSVTSFPDVAPAAGTTYAVTAAGDGYSLSSSAMLGYEPSLPTPSVALALDGGSLGWAAVAGAAAYSCVLTSGGAVHLQQVSTTTGCDVAALPEGSFLASIQALSADPEALGVGAAPAMPATFDVSHVRLGLLRRASSASLVLRAAGGRVDYGLVPGLAIWVGLAGPNGAPDGGAWSIEVTGPNLPASNPLRFDIQANFTWRVVWAYGLSPDPGLYTLVATNGVESVTTRFAIAPPQPLPLPGGVSATGQQRGAARVTWSPVEGAKAYFAAAWLGNSFVAGQWVTGTSADFLDGTFARGVTYDVFVAAVDVDVTANAAPTRVSASENSYTPASFTAP